MIDWREVRQRLQQSEAALAQALVVDQRRMEEVFRQRAAELAARSTQAAAPVATLRSLAFNLGPERYALELAALVEIFPYAKCSPVPGGPPQLLGVVNLRGEIRSIVDLAQMLDLPRDPERPPGYVVLVRGRGLEVGFRVDQVERIEHVRLDELSQAGGGLSFPTRYLRGLTQERLIVLDVAELLAAPLFSDG